MIAGTLASQRTLILLAKMKSGGPDAAAEDVTAVDCTAEDGTAELSKKGGRYGGIT